MTSVAEAGSKAAPTLPMTSAQLDLLAARNDSTYMSRLRRAVRRRSWPVLAVFVSIVFLQLLVTVLSIDLMSAVRAYVTGESLYSKSQKDAQLHLVNYAETRHEADFQLFMKSLEVPRGDRFAREEMQKAVFDSEVTRQAYLAGGNHPDDIAGAIRLFRLLQKTPLMSRAIETWTQGDRLVDKMRTLAIRAHEGIVAGQLQDPEVTNLRLAVLQINKELTPLEARFAAELSDAARQSERLLFWFNLTMAVLLGLTGSAFVLRSVRTQVATEEEVRLRRESLQRILDSAAEGLYGVDIKGRCTFINRSALRMLGYTKESELLGREMHDVVHHSHADGRPRPADQSSIAGSYREQREVHITDEVFWRRDGTSFAVEYWSHPMLKNGKFNGAVATFFDISDKIKLQAALQQGEVRIAGLVDAVNDGVMTIDANERIVLFNRAAERLFGVSSKEALGSPVERFIPRTTGKTRREARHELRFDYEDTGRVRELFGRRIDGRVFPLEASLSRLDSDEGTLVTAVLRDVTDLQTARAERDAMEALKASNAAKTEFLSRMSHELRTPLNAVLGFSQLIRLDTARPPAPEHVDQLRLIENAGSHLLALVNDVLDLSRVESGQMTVTLEPVELRTSIDDAIAMVMPLAASVGVKTWIAGHEGDLVTKSLAEGDEVTVVADRVRLRQVLVNLLSNAVKYNRPGGEVRISWQVCEDRCDVFVTDDGLGIGADKLDSLFEPFNRLGAENSKVEGTGIGLVLSRRLMELMGGGLRIESAQGQGTKASLTLERSQEDAVQDTMATPPSQHGSLDGVLHVLYAEDNEVNVEIVRQVMKYRPSVVFNSAETGALAFQKARTTRPDLMFVDMHLGDMTGLELARALRSDPATAGIRLVALSADALPEQINAAMAMGFEGYLTKPIDFRELLNVLDGRRTRRTRPEGFAS
jgi:PAS domain S-box-containing protein